MEKKLVTIQRNSRNYIWGGRDYFKDETGRVYCRYQDEPNQILSATKSEGEPECNLKQGITINIDNGAEVFINVNPWSS